MSTKKEILQKNNKIKQYFESLNSDKFKETFMNYIYDELIKDNQSALQTPVDFLQQMQKYQAKNNTKKTPSKVLSKAIDVQYAINCVFSSMNIDISLCLIISQFIVSTFALDGAWKTRWGDLYAFVDIAYYYIHNVKKDEKLKTNCMIFNMEYDQMMIDGVDTEVLFARYLEGTTYSEQDFIEIDDNKNNENPRFFELGHCFFIFENDSRAFQGSFKPISRECSDWNGAKLFGVNIAENKREKVFEMNENDKYLLRHANEQMNAMNLDEVQIKKQLQKYHGL